MNMTGWVSANSAPAMVWSPQVEGISSAHGASRTSASVRYASMARSCTGSEEDVASEVEYVLITHALVFLAELLRSCVPGGDLYWHAYERSCEICGL